MDKNKKNKRPTGEAVKPEDVKWLAGSDVQDIEYSQISAETLVYRSIEAANKKGDLVSARILKEQTGLGRTSIRYNINNLLEKKLIVRRFAIGQSGDSKVILPYYFIKPLEDKFNKIIDKMIGKKI